MNVTVDYIWFLSDLPKWAFAYDINISPNYLSDNLKTEYSRLSRNIKMKIDMFLIKHREHYLFSENLSNTLREHIVTLCEEFRIELPTTTHPEEEENQSEDSRARLEHITRHFDSDFQE